MSQIQRIYVIMAITMILLSISFVKCLPVTSKPIENTPENLAWEAWLMLPPSSNERTRKITPKSIFILNGSQDGTTHNGNSNLFSNSGSSLPQPQPQIQCPPNHRIDNSKCIPTLSIDRDKIMIQEFAQLFGNPVNGGGVTSDGSLSNSQNYNYEFEEYDYGDYNPDDSLTDDITFSNVNLNKPDFNNNEQPLKINLSLDKFPILFDNKPSPDNTEIRVQPFRGEESSTITDKVLSTTTTDQTLSTKAATTANYGDEGKRSTSEDAKPIGTSTFPTTISDTAKTRRHNSEPFIISTTTIDPIKQINDLEVSVDNTDTNLFSTTIETIDTTTILPILIPEQSMYSSGKNKTLTVTDYDSEEDGMQPLTTTPLDNGNYDIESNTELPEIEKVLADNLAEESLLYDQFFQDNLTQLSVEDGSTVDPIESTTLNDITTTELPETTTTIISENTNEQDMKALEQKIHPVVQPMASRFPHRSTIQLHEDTEPIMESIESNNRFVYHHLGSSATPTQERQSEKSNPAKDIAEQLRIINMIVEENKRKSQQLKFRFPDDHSRPTENGDRLRADIVRFPEVPTSTSQSSFVIPSASSFSFPQNRFEPDKYLFHRRYLQPSMPPSTPPSITSSTEKPLWWLPDSDRPLLIRVWSKRPSSGDGTISSEYQFRSSIGADSTTSSVAAAAASTTSGYRENSRSPTENLYREIPAQDVYKVLDAGRQWKHSSKR